MNLAHFPFDVQMCTVEIESFGYTMSDLKYVWHGGQDSVKMSPDVSLPQFNVLGHRQRLIEVRMRVIIETKSMSLLCLLTELIGLPSILSFVCLSRETRVL